MRVEMARLTGKLDNIRRLQEMGMINSFPTTAQTDKPIKGEDAAQIVSITGQGTMRSNKAQAISQNESSAGAVMDKISFYTTELHRLLDLVDENKKTKKARKKKKKPIVSRGSSVGSSGSSFL